MKRFKQVSLIFLLLLTTISSQFFTEDWLKDFLPSGLLEQAEHLNVEANAALQALLLVFAM